ncbi:MAG: hypothetical protein ABIG42_05120 [bacterium]
MHRSTVICIFFSVLIMMSACSKQHDREMQPAKATPEKIENSETDLNNPSLNTPGDDIPDNMLLNINHGSPRIPDSFSFSTNIPDSVPVDAMPSDLTSNELDQTGIESISVESEPGESTDPVNPEIPIEEYITSGTGSGENPSDMGPGDGDPQAPLNNTFLSVDTQFPGYELTERGWPEYIPIMPEFTVNFFSVDAEFKQIIAMGDLPGDDVREFYQSLAGWELSSEISSDMELGDYGDIPYVITFILVNSDEVLDVIIFEEEGSTVCQLKYSRKINPSD